MLAKCSIFVSEDRIVVASFLRGDYVVNSKDVLDAILNLNAHKNGGTCNLSDNILHAGRELSIHIAFLFTGMIYDFSWIISQTVWC